MSERRKKLTLCSTLCKGLSDGSALIFNAEYLVRIQFPLCYNFLLFLRYDGSEGCAFMQVMSHMETVPFFGTLTFNSYAPLLIVLLCLFTGLNLYGKILAWLGIEHDDALLSVKGEDWENKIEEGKILLRKSQNVFSNSSSSSNSSSNSNSSSSSNSNSNSNDLSSNNQQQFLSLTINEIF